MATTSITPCKNGLGPTGLAYATKQDAPHDASMKEINKRVLMLDCLNCSRLNFSKQMAAIWSAKRTQENGEIELYRIRQSFSHEELDPKNPADWKKCNKLGMALAKKLFPNRLVVVATQADGKGHMLHNHIEVCSQEPHTLKSLRDKDKLHGTIAYASDEICASAGLKRPAKLPRVRPNQFNVKSAVKVDKIAKRHRKDTTNPGFVETIQKILQKVLKRPDVVDYKSYQDAAEDAGVNVHIRRNKRNKVNGLSYLLLDPEKGQKRPIRANKLGEKFQAQMLEDNFELYKQKQIRERQRKRQQLQSAESAAENEQAKPQPNFARVNTKPKNNRNQKNSKTEKDKQNDDEFTF